MPERFRVQAEELRITFGLLINGRQLDLLKLLAAGSRCLTRLFFGLRDLSFLPLDQLSQLVNRGVVSVPL
jgi:hypothetical protein